MSDRKMVNLHPATARSLEIKKERINKGRKKEGKKPFTNGEIIELALRNLSAEHGIGS